MSATAAQIAQLRRMTAEPTQATYDDLALAGYIASHPLTDANHVEPSAPTWTATYDLAAAAADVWREKAAALADDYTYSADGVTLNRSEKYEHAVGQAHFWEARTAFGAIAQLQEPDPQKYGLWPYANRGVVNAPPDPADL